MLDWLAARWNELIDFLYRLVLTVMDFLRDFLWWALDNLIGVAVSLLAGVGSLLMKLNPLQYIDAIPDTTKHYMAITGFNECMGMIVVALTIRFTLQLIPFVRWGS